jgi:DNA modification methylase
VSQFLNAFLISKYKTKHPATFNANILSVLETVAPAGGIILDIFGGVGKIGALAKAGRTIISNEIEPRWAIVGRENGCDEVIIGDATNLSIESESIDAIITSPTYGNRLADIDKSQTRVGKDKKRSDYTRRTYRAYYGKDLNTNNSGNKMHWFNDHRGNKYRILHCKAWLEAARVLKLNGLLIINIKDHVRDGKVMKVSDWHRLMIESIGFEFISSLEISVHGDQNTRRRIWRDGRVSINHENIFVYRKCNYFIPHERYLLDHAQYPKQ